MATKTPKPITNFNEKCTDVHPRGASPWLGIRRLASVPDAGFPPRDICQAVVTDDERKAGVELVKQYREQEQIALDNDADRRQMDLARLGNGGKHGFEIAQLRKELEKCDYQTFVNAQNRLAELRKEAIAMCTPILERLIDSFDRQLTEQAIVREKELQTMGIALFHDGNDIAGYPTRTYELHSDPILNGLHVRREVARHKLGMEPVEAIGAAQWLCTPEEGTPFHWL